MSGDYRSKTVVSYAYDAFHWAISHRHCMDGWNWIKENGTPSLSPGCLAIALVYGRDLTSPGLMSQLT